MIRTTRQIDCSQRLRMQRARIHLHQLPDLSPLIRILTPSSYNSLEL